MKIVHEDTGEVQDLLEEALHAPYHTILEVWTKVLEPSEEERKTRISPQWANKIVSSYNGMTYASMGAFHERYFDKIKDLADILKAVVDDDDECMKHTSAEEDAQYNHHHYLTVLFGWQQRILLWELEWSWQDPHAAEELAAISEVHKMFFADQGITSYLDQIGFKFDDTDRQMLVEMLEETRKGME